MRFLHIFPNEKFTEPYIDFINNNFNSNEHLFLILDKGVGAEITPRNNVKKLSEDFKSLIILVNEMYKSKKIFLHGLFMRKIVLLFFLQPWLLKRVIGLYGVVIYIFINLEKRVLRVIFMNL